MSMNNVGIIVCSQDILNNIKCDCISQYLIQELNSLQYTIGKVTVIPNSESSTLNELVSSMRAFDIVIVISEKCGAVYKVIARMISEELEENEKLISFFAKSGEVYDKDEVVLPIQAKVMIVNDLYPIVHFQRIFILKESHLKDGFSRILKNHLLQYKKPKIFQKVIKIRQNGNSPAELMEINQLIDGVTVEFSTDDQFYIFKVQSLQLRSIVEFEKIMKQKFELHQLRFLDDSEVWEQVYGSGEIHIKNSINNIEECLAKYGPDNIFVSFNGGKDCTVLLHLVLTVIMKKYPFYTKPIFCLYVQSEKPFPEQEEFIALTKSFYNLKIITIRSGIKDALQQVLEKFSNYKACFMGTRRTDPYSHDLNVFQMTDSNWPTIMRVSPLLDWHYSDIWDYLLFYKVPYCKLYDLGFTSLGNTVNTVRNPSLIYYDEFENKETYLPAYKLLKEAKERNGREAT